MRFTEASGSACPSLEELYHLGRGALPRGRVEPLASHVRACARCREEQEWLGGVAGAVASGPLPEPRASAYERSIAVFAHTRPKPARQSGWSLASLVRDSFAMPLVTGVRSKGATARRFLYRAEAGDLDIEVREVRLGEPAFHVTGQLLVPGGRPPTAVLAVLWREGTVAAHATADAVGVFEIPRIEPGTYRLEVWVPGESAGIRVESLALTGEAP